MKEGGKVLGDVIFNSRHSLDLNLKLKSYPSIPQSTEEYEEIEIEGRNGTLILNKGTYKNKQITFNFTRLSDSFLDFDDVYYWLNNINDKRLIWGRRDRCYIVKKIVYGDIQQEYETIGNFDVTFMCEPFLEDLESTKQKIIGNGFNIFYLGTAPGDSIIKVGGNGNIQIAINSEAMTIKNVNEYVEIDSKLLQVRNKNGTSKDMDTLGDFPVLKNGLNIISYSGNIYKLEIEYTNKYL